MSGADKNRCETSWPGEGHGGQVWEPDGSRADVVDFSANLWPDRKAAQLLRHALSSTQLADYPDADCRALVRAVAHRHGLTPAHVLPANGSTEALYVAMLALRPSSLALFEPTFSEYDRAAQWSASPNAVPVRRSIGEAEHGFVPTLAVPNAAVAVLANPNNPTGVLLDRPTVAAWVAECEAAGIAVIVDEAFMEFVPGAAQVTMLSLLDRHRRLIVLRSMTKRHGLAGVRLGFAFGHPDLIAELHGRRIPWSVNTLAQHVGATLAEAADDAAVLSEVARERLFLSRGLERLGWRVFPSAANFLLCRLPGDNADVLAALRRQGILLRDASNFCGLDAHYVRCAVRRRTDNRRLLHALLLAAPSGHVRRASTRMGGDR